MLEIYVTNGELYDSEQQKVYQLTEPFIAKLEHSLLSISKWESIWEKPFFEHETLKNGGKKTLQEKMSYISCMLLNDLTDTQLMFLCDGHMSDINTYVNSPHTATTIHRASKSNKTKRGPVITSELVYFKMFQHGIPKECETWFINRLLTLIEVFDIKTAEAEKKSNPKNSKVNRTRDFSKQRSLNDARRAALKTKG